MTFISIIFYIKEYNLLLLCSDICIVTLKMLRFLLDLIVIFIMYYYIIYLIKK